MNDERDVREMLASAVEGDAGPRYSPEEVLTSARRATAQRRAVLTSAVAVAAVLVAGAGVLVAANGPSTAESASGAVLTTTAHQPHVPVPGEVPAVPNTPEHAADLTAKLVAANVIPSGYDLAPALGAQAGPMEFYRFGEDSADGYKATAVFADAKGRVTVTMFVRSASAGPDCTSGRLCVAATPVPGMGRAVEPVVRYVDGVELTTIRQATGGEPSDLSVWARFPDGTQVHASVSNTVTEVVGGGPSTWGPTRDSVPFTEEQLIDMVLKPGFHY